MNERILEINIELKHLNQRRRDLLNERHQLLSVSELHYGLIFAIIENYPGISRREIQDKLGDIEINSQTLSNYLTTLRRRGQTENRGTKKYPQWYVKKQVTSESLLNWQ